MLEPPDGAAVGPMGTQQHLPYMTWHPPSTRGIEVVDVEARVAHDTGHFLETVHTFWVFVVVEVTLVLRAAVGLEGRPEPVADHKKVLRDPRRADKARPEPHLLPTSRHNLTPGEKYITGCGM